MRITREIVLHTAKLAKLDLGRLDDSVVEKLIGDLDSVLEYVAQLEELDTGDVPPTTHAVPTGITLRPDEATPGVGRDAILANAPDTADGFFVVPRVIAE